MEEEAQTEFVGGDGDVENDAAHSAPSDPVIAERLGEPSEPEAIYLEEASKYRPIATGDIYEGVVVPGSTSEEAAHGLTMLLAHPSAMRKGAELEPRARAACVAPVNDLSRKKWSSGHYNVFPLPLLARIAQANGFSIDDRGWGTLLELAAPVETSQLDVCRRVACLSPQGIHLLLQRLVHADTRVAVKVEALAETFAPKLEELEMLQTWNEELVAPKIESDGHLLEELLAAAQQFENVMNDKTEHRATSLREMLESRNRVGEASRAGEAHRLFAEEVRSRRSI